MIQRIQTIYLLLTAIAGFLMTKLPLYTGTMAAGTTETYLATECLPLFAISMVAALLAFIAIFLFKNRKLQKRLTMFGFLLSLALVGLAVYMYEQFSTTPGLAKASYSWGSLLPIAMVIGFIMAWVNIRKDEKLIKSLDRLR